MVTIVEGGAGADVLEGDFSYNNDTVSYASSDDWVQVSLMDDTATGGHASGDTISYFENVTGSMHNDVLIGNNMANVLRGLAGNDGLQGGRGDNTLEGGVGDDIFVFSPGDASSEDVIVDFNDGNDKLDLSAYDIASTDDLEMREQGGDVIIDLSDYGGGAIRLLNFDLASFSMDLNDDFLL